MSSMDLVGGLANILAMEGDGVGQGGGPTDIDPIGSGVGLSGEVLALVLGAPITDNDLKKPNLLLYNGSNRSPFYCVDGWEHFCVYFGMSSLSCLISENPYSGNKT